MTDDTALDTSITEPSMTPGEVEMVLFALNWTAVRLTAQPMPGPWTGVDRDAKLDRPARFTLDPNELPNARRLLVDLHDEYARHVGPADLFREAVDGLVGEDPPQQ